MHTLESNIGHVNTDSRSIEEPYSQVLQLAEELRRMHQEGVFGACVDPNRIAWNNGRIQLARDSSDALTPYLSPEQVLGEPADERSDIFAFGAAAYELFSGRRAFEATEPEELKIEILEQSPEPLTGVPPQTIFIINRCLQKKPADRWQRIHSVVIELKLAYAGVRQARSAAEWKDRVTSLHSEVAAHDERITAHQASQERAELEIRQLIQAVEQRTRDHETGFSRIHDTLAEVQESVSFLRKSAQAQARAIEGMESAASQTDEVIEHVVEAFGMMYQTMVDRGEAKVLVVSGEER